MSVYKDLGFFALKSVLTLNGGAIIIVLTFVSGVLGADRGAQLLNIPLVESSIAAFLIGLFFCFISVVANMAMALRFIANPKESSGFSTFLFWLFVPAAVSFAFFAVGVSVALQALK